MTYYEEMGIGPDASPDEVRQAYKAMARLLHPDGQTDPKLRALAEGQMKRLSEVVRILSDPQARREYDAGLSGGDRTGLRLGEVRRRGLVGRPQGVPIWVNWAVQNWFWVSLTAVVLAAGTWYFAAADTGDGGKAAAPLPIAAAMPAQSPGPRTVKAATQAAKAIIRDDQPAEARVKLAKPAAPETAAAAPEDPLPVAPPVQPPIASELPVAAKPAPVRQVVIANESPFAGDWLYAPSQEEAPAAGQYAATYIELVLQEQTGKLVGHYWAQYSIPDKAISPEVRLQVEGTPSAEKSARLEWTAGDGAKGEMELKLGPSNLITVRWWTTVFGNRDALRSGTALLFRETKQ